MRFIYAQAEAFFLPTASAFPCLASPKRANNEPAGRSSLMSSAAATAVAAISTPRPNSRLSDFDQMNDSCATLLTKIAGGDESAMSELYDTTVSLLLGLALRILRDRSVAEEVILDAYLQVWQQARSYDRDRGRPLTWLSIIARTRAVDRLRSVSSYSRYESRFALTTVSSDQALTSPEESAWMAERRRVVLGAINTYLSADERQAIDLAYFSGLSHGEIALQLGEPLGTVKTRIRAGMRKLRAVLIPVLGAYS